MITIAGTASDDGLLEFEGTDWAADSKAVKLVLYKQVPERAFFLSHMVGGMLLFGRVIILTTCIERLVTNSKNAPVLLFWFDKVPVLDGLIVVPTLTVSMISGTGLSIVQYGGLNIAPPHVMSEPFFGLSLHLCPSGPPLIWPHRALP